MNKELSRRITVVSFFAMTSVICWHCYCDSGFEKYALPLFFYWAVPWFFMISGFLLAYSLERKSAIAVVKSKCISLLVPYLIWSLIGACVMGLTYCGGVLDVLGIVPNRIFPTGNQSLWYLRAIIIFSLAGILVDAFFRRCSSFRPFVTAMSLCVFLTLVNKYLLQISTGSSPLYFCFGFAIYAVNGKLILFKKRISLVVSMVSLMLFAAVKVLYFLKGYTSAVPGGTLLTNFSTCFWIVAIWFGIGVIPKRMIERVCGMKFLYVSAFVYFMHYPILRKIIGVAQLKGNIAFVASCLIAPCFFVGLAMVVKVMAPRFYRIASGGRV